ncbi:MAG: hypothetical protein MRZ79_25335 [Bacteroidia bacterium]|nr:hypothetical protein [Bacteroidia bacterium]
MKKIDTYRDWILENINSKLDEDKQKELRQAFDQYPELKKYEKEAAKLNGLLETHMHTYSGFFAEKVMQQIEAPDKGVKAWEKLPVGFKWISMPALALTVFLLIFSVWGEEKLDLDTLAGTNEVHVENMMIADWSDF